MNTKHSIKPELKRLLANILGIFVILAMAFPVTGNVAALVESAPPEGGHDGSEGVGHPNSCNAFGWAQDPDDNTREVEVRILDNGNEIASGSTEDHGFYFNLWGLFPTYEEHQITAQAYDEETGTWVDLAGTPRLLNCVNYDIFLLNTKNGKVERLTTLENTGEYNPSWSPDGKRIVHDVTDANFHALYITDIKTRMSQPLKLRYGTPSCQTQLKMRRHSEGGCRQVMGAPGPARTADPHCLQEVFACDLALAETSAIALLMVERP